MNVRTRSHSVVRLAAQLAVVVGVVASSSPTSTFAQPGRRWRMAFSGRPPARTSRRCASRQGLRPNGPASQPATSSLPSRPGRPIPRRRKFIPSDGDRAAARGRTRAVAHLHDPPDELGTDAAVAGRADPGGSRVLYFVLAAVGLFTLLVGAGVRVRRPAIRRRCISSGCPSRSSACSPSRSAAGSTRSTGSSTGRTSCAHAAAAAAVPALRARVPRAAGQLGAHRRRAVTLLPLLYLPALLLGGARVATSC